MIEIIKHHTVLVGIVLGVFAYSIWTDISTRKRRQKLKDLMEKEKPNAHL